MQNINIRFSNVTQLSFELKKRGVKDNKSLFVQIFLAQREEGIIENIQELFAQEYPQSGLIGTTTDGIIANGELLGAQKEHLASVTLFETTEVTTALVEYDENLLCSFELGLTMAQRLVAADTQIIFAFSDGIYTNGEEFVKGIGSVCAETPLAGGMAADNGELKETYVFNKTKVTNRGAVGAALTSKNLHITTNYTFDWKPIGKKLKIEKAEKNRIYKIDGMSAVEVYAKYMGEDVARRLPQIGIEFPLIVKRDNINIGRAVLAKHDDGSLSFAGNFDEGEYARFGVGVAQEILDASCKEYKKTLEKIDYQPEVAFVYSCMARRRFLAEEIEAELKLIENIAPTSGFFTYGEFFHYWQENQLLNETMTVVVLSESSEPFLKSELPECYELTKKKEIKTNHVLARLANRVSDELEELNSNLQNRIKESNALIMQQAYFDKLTGLPNRLSLINRLDESLGGVLLLVNIDDFTTINDFYGHEVGDTVLRKLALVLLDLIDRKGGEVYKLPSDEFAIVVTLEHTQEAIESLMREIVSVVEHAEFRVNNVRIHVSVTIAAAYINEKRMGLTNADMTLKMAKKASKSFMIFDEDLQLSSKYAKNIAMVHTIKNAIANDNILPYFQPIFSLEDESIEKYESLVRLVDDDGRVLSPAEFLSISEKIKLYSKITKIMIQKSFSFFEGTGISFSINLAFSDILNEKTRAYLFKKIEEYDIAAQLTIEILETQEFDKNETIAAFIDDVYRVGAKIAIDDFGSGFANFKYMTTIKSDYMKIDGSLIRDIVDDENDRLVVETIVSFAKKLGKKTIAEFVHSKEVYDMVKSLGIDYAQGFYLAKPGPTICQE